ncbi:MAG TPA: hypothetical protein ENJ19_03100 [Gammaproteobacteria bacterium]|nr:hypothetical protein [Gammaproteobacteria bacterium]
MIPASVVGAFVFLISANRREYSVLKDVMAHAADVEGQQGMLWRFGPLFDELGKSSAQVSKVLTLSREGRGADIEPEDYAETVRELYAALSGGGGRSISAEAAGKVESNLAGLRPS